MFKIEYRMLNNLLLSDEQVVDVDTLYDAELVAVVGSAQKLGVATVEMRHYDNLLYGVYLEGSLVGRFRITTVSELTEITPLTTF